MGFCENIRAACRAIMADAQHVRVDEAALLGLAPGVPPQLDAADHFLEGDPAAVATYVLALDAVNFGSGWFAGLRGPGGSPFGYETVARALAERFRAAVPSPAGLAALDPAPLFGLPHGHPLAKHFARALQELGAFLDERPALERIADANGSAERFAAQLAAALPLWRDPLAKRAQLVGSDLVLARVAAFTDLDALTIFADNLVPHVLRVDGALVLDASLAAHLDAGRMLPPGDAELELRAASVVAGARLAAHLGVTERDLDGMLWQRGQAARYADPPPHRTATTNY